MIEIQNLSRRYGKTLAVDGISCKIRNGHLYGLVGPEGSGKSTLLELMTGCIRPTEGTVLINGYDICKSPKEAKRQIGYLPEQLPLLEDMTPAEALSLFAEIKGVRDEVLDRQVKETLTLCGLNAVKHTLIRNLPAPLRLRVGIAQTLLGNPDIIILDEPLTESDPLSRVELRVLIRRLGEKWTVVISAPTVADLGGICDHVITLSDGRIVSDEDVEPTPAEAADAYEDETLEDEELANEMPGVDTPDTDARSDEEVTD